MLIRMYKNGQKHDINCTFTFKDYMKLLVKDSVKHTMHNKIVYKLKRRAWIPSESTILFR